MHRHARPIFAALAAATSVGMACAADPGDPSKLSSSVQSSSGSSSGGSSSSSSGSSSGATASSGSSSGSSSGGSSSSSGGSSGAGSSSSSGSGSSGGSSGSSSGGPADAGIDSGRTCATGGNSATVSYCTTDTQNLTTENTITFKLSIGNGGFTSLNLSNVTLRYWFTADNNPTSTITFTSDYSQNGNNAITNDVVGTFFPAPAANVTPTSDSYLELSFHAPDASLGTLNLPVLSATGAMIQVRLHGPGGQFSDIFNETNDYSFTALDKDCTNFATTENITAYDNGVLVWGCEPSGGGSASTPPPIGDASTSEVGAD